MAVTNGVTATFFSDFGPTHVVTDANGEPPISNPVDNIEVVEEDGSHYLVITVTRTKHDLGMSFLIFLLFSCRSVVAFSSSSSLILCRRR